MKIEKTIEIAKTYKMDGKIFKTDIDDCTFSYEDNPAIFRKAYDKEVKEYYDGDKEALTIQDFFTDRWEDFIEFDYYCDDEYDDILDFVFDFYKDNVLKNILNKKK